MTARARVLRIAWFAGGGGRSGAWSRLRGRWRRGWGDGFRPPSPGTAVPCEYRLRRGAFGRDRGHAVGVFRGRFSGFRAFDAPGDTKDRFDVGIVGHLRWRGEDFDAARLDAALLERGRFSVASRARDLPMEALERLEGLGSVALDRHHPVGALGLDDPPCRLAKGVERVESAQTAGRRRGLERGVDGGDLPALVGIVEDRDRHAGPVLDPRDRLVLILAGAVGAAKARAVDRGRVADPQARLRPAPQSLLDPRRVGVLQHPVHGRLGHRFLPAGVRVLPRTDLRQILLRHRLRGARRCHRAVPIRPPRPHPHAPHRSDAVRAPLRAPDVGKRRTMRVHRAQRPRRPAAPRRPQRPRRRKRRTIPQPTTGVTTQRNPVPIFRLPVRIGRAPVGACIALAPAHARPVRRPVQGAAELRRRDPRLRHPQWSAVRSLPVIAETPLHPRPRKRGKTPKRPATPQNHKPRVVSDQVQPLQRFLAAPAHPTVPRRTAEESAASGVHRAAAGSIPRDWWVDPAASPGPRQYDRGRILCSLRAAPGRIPAGGTKADSGAFRSFRMQPEYPRNR